MAVCQELGLRDFLALRLLVDSFLMAYRANHRCDKLKKKKRILSCKRLTQISALCANYDIIENPSFSPIESHTMTRKDIDP
jgi:hypothetical protein